MINNRYEGKLPYGLTFDLKREQVERILGQPDSSGCIKTVGCWGTYSSKGIVQLVYESEKPDDPNTRIESPTITNRLLAALFFQLCRFVIHHLQMMM